MNLDDVIVGFLPLLDAALPILAQEKGFAAAEGLQLSLIRETSWANIRDRVSVGQFDVAHMLAPMPIAASLGLNPVNMPMIAPMALGLGGNAVTVSTALAAEMAGMGFDGDLSARGAGESLRRVIAAGRRNRLRFGVVHPHSGHNYELRYWLAASGIDPEVDVEIVVMPPPFLPDALGTEGLDGYCVGEPWNSVAVVRGHGRIVTTKSAIWQSSPEKVLGTTAAWAAEYPDRLSALLIALHRASEWLGQPANLGEAARILAQPAYLDQPANVIHAGLAGRLPLPDGGSVQVEDFFIPQARAATFPWQSHALWFYSQMVRWGQVAHTSEHAEAARQSYRPDIYRRVIAGIDTAVPAANSKVEGTLTEPSPVGVSKGSLTIGPDGFFDERIFDPDQLDAYIIGQRRTTTHKV